MRCELGLSSRGFLHSHEVGWAEAEAEDVKAVADQAVFERGACARCCKGVDDQYGLLCGGEVERRLEPVTGNQHFQRGQQRAKIFARGKRRTMHDSGIV